MQTRIALGLFTLIIAGCSSSTPVSPANTHASPSGPMQAAVAQVGNELFVGGFQLHVDRNKMSAEIIAPERLAASQPPQNLLFDLDISNFLRASNLRLAGLALQGDGDITLNIEHKHPFPAPDTTQPITAQNRADLSYSGRMLVLADDNVSSAGYDGTTYTFDAGVLENPDGFVYTGDLLLEEELSANLFPYKLIVDEAADNRLNVSNGNNAAGSYDPGLGGWQRANLGDDGNGWTGYDVLHAGQAVQFPLTISSEVFAGGPYDVEVAILIKYVDPRGTGNRNFRFPFDPADVSQFAYRMPHGAIDAGILRGCPDLYLNENAAATVDLDYTLRDWDAKAMEADDGDLSDDTDVALVRPGASGIPAVELVADAITTPVALTVENPDSSGQSSDEFKLSGTLANTAGASPGEYWGLVVATDPENADPDANQYRFGVDPETIDADPARALPIRTFLPTRITVYPNDNWVRLFGNFDFDATGNVAMDAQDNVYVYGEAYEPGIDLTHGRCEDSNTNTNDASWYLAKFDSAGRLVWSHVWIGPELDDFLRLKFFGLGLDSTGNVFLSGSFSPSGTDPVMQDFDPTDGDDIREITPGDGYLVSLDSAGNYRNTYVWESDEGFTPGVVWADASDNLFIRGFFRGTVDLDPTAGTDSQSADSDGANCLLRFDSGFNYQWGIVQQEVNISDLAFAGTNLLLTGNYFNNNDFDPGPGSEPRPADGVVDAFLLTLNQDGEYVDVKTWGGPEDEFQNSVRVDGSGNISIAGYFEALVDFDPGAGSQPITPAGRTDGYFLQLAPDQTFVRVTTWGAADVNTTARTHFEVPSGDVLIPSSFGGTVDFDPGPGTAELTAVSTSSDLAFLTLDSSGNFVSVFQYGIPGQFFSSFGLVAYGGGDHIVHTDRLEETADVAPGPAEVILGPASGRSDTLLMRLNADGSM